MSLPDQGDGSCFVLRQSSVQLVSYLIDINTGSQFFAGGGAVPLGGAASGNRGIVNQITPPVVNPEIIKSLHGSIMDDFKEVINRVTIR